MSYPIVKIGRLRCIRASSRKTRSRASSCKNAEEPKEFEQGRMLPATLLRGQGGSGWLRGERWDGGVIAAGWRSNSSGSGLCCCTPWERSRLSGPA